VKRSRWAVLLLLTGAHALSAAAALAVAPLAPVLLDALGLTRAQIGLLVPAIYLGGVLMSMPAGWITDRLGIRATLAAGLLLEAAMIALASEASHFTTLLACLFGAGVGFSVVNPTTGKAIIERFPMRERGVAMGIKQTGLTVGGMLAAFTLPAVAVRWGWQTAFAVAGGCAALGALAGALSGRGQSAAAQPAIEDPPRFAEVGRFLRNRSFVVLLVSGFTMALTQSSVLAYFALYARDRLGYGVIAAGGLLAAAQAGGTVSRLAWGAVSDRLFGGRRRPCLIINASIGAAACLVFALGLPLPGAVATLVTFVFGAGAFGWTGLYLALAAEVGGTRYAGLLTGVAVTCAWSGILVGPALFGFALETFGTYRWPWLALTCSGATVAVVLSRIAPLVNRG
jgi:ACS family hexuronate transporter-like MFS transporter